MSESLLPESGLPSSNVSALRREFLQWASLSPLVLSSAAINATVGTPEALGTVDGDPAIRITSPVPHRVFQRKKYQPHQSHDHAVGGPQKGHAEITLAWTCEVAGDWKWEARCVPLTDCFGTGTDWMALTPERKGSNYAVPYVIPAGGWYRLELRGNQPSAKPLEGAVEPVGVGEVILVAGQSYAEGANDAVLKVTEPQGRVSCLDVQARTWRIAHDPQPQKGTGGTIWPPLGDLLVPLLQTPVGFVNVAVGGTAIRQWLPGEALYQGLVAGAKGVGDFRFVLWQQGESDVIEKTTKEVYVERLRTIRKAFADAIGQDRKWLLAKSTLHPTVYNIPEGEETIRSAIHSLWNQPGFAPGPDTDLLNGDNRGGPNTRRHFTGIGQVRAAQLWFASIWRELSELPR